MEVPHPFLRACINTVIDQENFEVHPSVELSHGAKAGEGFSSKTYALTAKGSDKCLRLFIKYLPEENIKHKLQMYKEMFFQERRFYDEIYPAMVIFQESQKFGPIFNNVPKYYSFEILGKLTAPIILENLKPQGYTIRDFREIDETHVKLTMETYAKFHAVFYAMKDQQLELFERLAFGIQDLLCLAHKEIGIVDYIYVCVNRFLQTLDPEFDKQMLEKCGDLGENLVELISTVSNEVDEYSVICHGDSWSSNIMYLYDEESNTPIDIKLIDFQVQKYNSPVLDIVYFFYTVATKDLLKNVDFYRDFYYEILTTHLQKMDTDPNKMYPREVYELHWKKFAKFGLGMAFFIMRERLRNQCEHINNFESIDGRIMVPSESFPGEDWFNSRIKTLLEHFIERDLL